jgi:hypothetical protein
MSDPFDEDADLRAILETLDPKAGETLRRVLIHGQADRDAIANGGGPPIQCPRSAAPCPGQRRLPRWTRLGPS